MAVEVNYFAVVSAQNCWLGNNNSYFLFQGGRGSDGPL